MKCPKCSGKLYVKETRYMEASNATRRRFECYDCNARHTTHERFDSEEKAREEERQRIVRMVKIAKARETWKLPEMPVQLELFG